MTMDAAARTRLLRLCTAAITYPRTEFIAACRAAVPELLAEIERLERELSGASNAVRIFGETSGLVEARIHAMQARAERAEAALLRALVDNNRVLPSTDEAGWVKQARAVLAEVKP